MYNSPWQPSMPARGVVNDGVASDGVARLRPGSSPVRAATTRSQHPWGWMGPGGPPGLQNRCAVVRASAGGFDSHASPPVVPDARAARRAPVVRRLPPRPAAAHDRRRGVRRRDAPSRRPFVAAAVGDLARAAPLVPRARRSRRRVRQRCRWRRSCRARRARLRRDVERPVPTCAVRTWRVLIAASQVGRARSCSSGATSAPSSSASASSATSATKLYLSLLGKSMTFHSLQPVGDTMARATNDVREVNLMFNPGMNLVVGSANFLVMPVLLRAPLPPVAGPDPARCPSPVLLAAAQYLRQLGTDHRRGARQAFGRMNARLAEALDGIEVVKGTRAGGRGGRPLRSRGRRLSATPSCARATSRRASCRCCCWAGRRRGASCTRCCSTAQACSTWARWSAYVGLIAALRLPDLRLAVRLLAGVAGAWPAPRASSS